jgi:hypothetical protein
LGTTSQQSRLRNLYPIIDANVLVIGHRGVFGQDELFVKEDVSRIPTDPSTVDKWGTSGGMGDRIDTFINRGIEVIADDRRRYLWNQGYSSIGGLNFNYDVVVNPEGRVQQVLGAWSAERAVEPSWLQPADLIMLPEAIVGLIRGAGRGVMWVIARWAASRAAARGTARELTEVAVDGFRRSGPVTAEEMEAHLHDVVANRPELATLMRGAGMDGEALRRQTLQALKDWEYLQGRSVRIVDNGAVQSVAGARNFASLRPNGELWIEKQVIDDTVEFEVHIRPGDVIRERIGEGRFEDVTSKARYFFGEVKHELAADALAGRGGVLDGSVLAHVGPNFSRANNSLFYLEAAIDRGDIVVLR